MLTDFDEQLGRPFEHEARLKELVAKQAELNAALDLDKGEQQAAAPADADAGLDEKRSPGKWRPRKRPDYQEPEYVDIGLDAKSGPVAPESGNDMRL